MKDVLFPDDNASILKLPRFDNLERTRESRATRTNAAMRIWKGIKILCIGLVGGRRNVEHSSNIFKYLSVLVILNAVKDLPRQSI